MAGPERNVPYIFDVALIDSLTGDFKIDPTIVSGDFKVAKESGSFVNLATLPVISPIGTSNLKVSLSATEMDADRLVVEALDVVGEEWDGMRSRIETEATPGGTSKILDILEGDHIEDSKRVIINKKNTSIPVLDKKIVGSLLKSNVTIRTLEQP